jgi:hypothetical protein
VNGSDRVTHPTWANHVNSFTAVANSRSLAPRAQLDDESNARCVLRSDLRNLSLTASIILPLDLNRERFGPRHTPYLGQSRQQLYCGGVLLLSRRSLAPRAQLDDESNARCVLRSDLRSLSMTASIILPLDLNRERFGPRHTPYIVLLLYSPLSPLSRSAVVTIVTVKHKSLVTSPQINSLGLVCTSFSVFFMPRL